jgi:hypothetical protein
MLDVLERDVARLPTLLSHEPAPRPGLVPTAVPELDETPRSRQPVQLGLF